MNHQPARVRVIIVTDGDWTARQAVKTASHSLGLYLLKAAAGNPMPLSGPLKPPRHRRLEGDTVQILDCYPDLLVVGCGDPGKMDGLDSAGNGAEVTRKCLELILEGSDSLAR